MDPLSLLLITEVMYNPASSERPPVKTEWVEVYNPGDKPIDLKGWYLADEDGKTDPVGGDARLAPHAAAVFVPAAVTADQFHKAWGDRVTVYRLDHWGRGGLGGLANNPSAANETLTLHRPDGSAADRVNYDDTGDWPADVPQGPSIVLKPGHLSAADNDHGKNWTRARAGEAGAHHSRSTRIFDGRDIGSPGVVPEPKADHGGD